MKDRNGLTFCILLGLAGWALGASADSHASGRSVANALGGQATEAPKRATSDKATYEILIEFSRSTVPQEVSTSDTARNDTWDVYGLRVMANGLWKVEKGEYTPGYKTAKGNTRARLNVGKVQKTDWKTEYAWVVFLDPMFSKGFLYQMPAHEGLKATVRHIPFKYGEHRVVWPELAELRPVMLDAFTSLGCLEVWVRIGDPSDLSDKIRAIDTAVNFSDQGFEVNYQDRDVEVALEALKSSQNTVVNGYCLLRDEILKAAEELVMKKKDKSIAESDLNAMKNATDPSVLQEKITALQKVIASNADTMRKMRSNKIATSSEAIRLDEETKKLKDELFEQQNALNKTSAMRKQNEMTRLKKQAELEKADQAIGQLDLRMLELIKRKADMLNSLKGKLPMTATVIVDAPANKRDKK